MSTNWLTKINEWFNGPVNPALQKNPEMVAAKTEAGILKAEEDFESRPKPVDRKNSRGGFRLVPRYPNKGLSSRKSKTELK